MRAANVKYFVVKNTLLRLAANETGLSELILFFTDLQLLDCQRTQLLPQKVISDFAKDNEKLEIKSGFMDGKILSNDEIV